MGGKEGRRGGEEGRRGGGEEGGEGEWESGRVGGYRGRNRNGGDYLTMSSVGAHFYLVSTCVDCRWRT